MIASSRRSGSDAQAQRRRRRGEKGVDIGPVVDPTQLERDRNYIRIGQEEGATLACAVPGRTTHARIFPAAHVAHRGHQQHADQSEEIFGRSRACFRARDYDEALAIANDTESGSRRHLHHLAETRDSLQRNAQAGMVMVNVPTAGVDFTFHRRPV